MSKHLLLKELSRYNIGTFADIIYRNALLYPDNEAFVYEKQRISHAQYNSRINKIVHSIQKMGVKKGETIGILSWNCLQFAELYGIAYKGGYIASPFNPRLTVEELDYIINYSETKVLFFGPELVDTVNALKSRIPKVKNFIVLEGSAENMIAYEDLIASNPDNEPDIVITEDDLTCIIYTSGTTGVPRGALYTQRALIDDARTFAINISAQSYCKHLQVTPQFHIAGNTWLRTFTYMGACSIIHKFFDPAAILQTIHNEKATHMNIVPTQLVAMLNVPDIDKYDLSSMKLIWYGASAMPLEVLKKGINTFGNVFGEGYGQSESGIRSCHQSRS